MTLRVCLAVLVAAFAAASCTDRTPTEPLAQVQPAPAVEVKPPYREISMKAMGQRVPVIMYHDVIDVRDKNAQWFDCTTEEFEEQMRYLEENGITPISLDQLYAHLNKGEQIPDKSVVLTFDDNYQGFHDRALPILRSRNFPAAVFVHTGFVGNKEGLHPKMDWATLKELAKDPLVTIGNHTITHPDDITLVSLEQQIKEMNDSKKELETQLGKPVPYLAYPNGKNDASVQELAKAAGHTMAFSIDNGLAEESPSIMCVNRYVHTRFEKAFEDLDNAIKGGGAALFSATLKQAPVTYQEGVYERVKLGLIFGGTPTTLMSEKREGVLDFIKRTQGAVAGINGGFFAVSDVSSDDNRMVGPLKTAAMPSVVPDVAKERWDKLRNRPVLLWGESSFSIVPYQPETMRSNECFEDFMPDLTDTFLAGVWLVHNGVARTAEEMNVFGAKDIQDFRRRAFLGVTADGVMVLGAALDSFTSEQVARAAAAAGVYEAVLLDSGFSTSLVYGKSIKASGHSNKDHASRPVPHAVVLLGNLDPSTAQLGKADPVKATEERPRRKRGRP